jgi:hypothetical protein
MKTKVLYNASFGEFSFSALATAELRKIGIEVRENGCYRGSRHDPRLIEVIERLGLKESSGRYARLAIFEFEGRRYRIDECDGMESVITPMPVDYDWIEV